MVKFYSGFFVCLLFLIVGYAGESLAEQPIAFVDRTQIGENETLNLTIEMSSQTDSLDVSALSKDFEILNQSKSSQINIVNGRMESKNQWIFTLMPKSNGDLIIPSIVVGTNVTNPIKVTVQKNKTLSGSDTPDLFLDVSVDTHNPYVQSQIRYTVQLFQGISLREGNLTEPQFDNAIVERLGEGTSFNTVKNGRRYRVTERQYAIFPQSSGELTIPPIVFNGEIAQQSSRSQDLNFFGMDPFNRMFTPGKPVRVRSEPIQLNVRPQAKEFKGNWWLPAKNVELQENWTSNKALYYVGEPVTRTITLQGTGITSAQLPDLPVDELKHANLYPDKASKESQMIDGSLVATKQQKIAIIPSQAGRIILPKIEVHWWDIVQDKARTAVLPEKTIDVLPATNQSISANNDVQKFEPGLPTPTLQTGVELSEARNVAPQSTVLVIVSGFLFVAWITTLVLWRQHYNKLRHPRSHTNLQTQESYKQARQKFQVACEQNKASMARETLLVLSKIVWPHAVIRNLKDVAELINDDNSTQALSELDQSLYGTNTTTWNGSVFFQRLNPWLKSKAQKGQKIPPALPELYST